MKAGLRQLPPWASNPRGLGAGVFIHQLLSVITQGGLEREGLVPQHFLPTMLIGDSGKRCWQVEGNRNPPKW